jgi:hypothetical protein
MESVPAARLEALNVAVLPLSIAVPIVVVPFMNGTVPMGNELAVERTVAVSVTGWFVLTTALFKASVVLLRISRKPSQGKDEEQRPEMHLKSGE